jgi:predicted nucleotidyltransferase
MAQKVDDLFLAEISGRLAREFQPECIILFGSHAWGVPTEDSDIDLLVILSDSEERPAQRTARAHHCMEGLMMPFDILVKTRAEVDRTARVRASLMRQALEEGRVIYAGERQDRVGSSLAK